MCCVGGGPRRRAKPEGNGSGRKPAPHTTQQRTAPAPLAEGIERDIIDIYFYVFIFFTPFTSIDLHPWGGSALMFQGRAWQIEATPCRVGYRSVARNPARHGAVRCVGCRSVARNPTHRTELRFATGCPGTSRRGVGKNNTGGSEAPPTALPLSPCPFGAGARGALSGLAWDGGESVAVPAIFSTPRE